MEFIILFVWLLAIPYCIGLLPARFMSAERRSLGTTLLSGYLIFLALFEIVAIIVVLKVVYNALTTLIAWFTPLALTLAALGLASEIVSRKSLKQLLPLNKLGKSLWTLSWEEKIIWLLFGFILVFQLYMSFSRVSFDGDDAFLSSTP
jgi:hypothetical protein